MCIRDSSYSRAIEKARALAASGGMNAFQKLEIIFHACLESSSELKRQEQSATFNEMQQSALIHQRFIRILISRLKPILADIIRQGIGEGSICCDYPEAVSYTHLDVYKRQVYDGAFFLQFCWLKDKERPEGGGSLWPFLDVFGCDFQI